MQACPAPQLRILPVHRFPYRGLGPGALGLVSSAARMWLLLPGYYGTNIRSQGHVTVFEECTASIIPALASWALPHSPLAPKVHFLLWSELHSSYF